MSERADMHEIIVEDLLAINEFIQEHAGVEDIVARGAFRRIEAALTRTVSPSPEQLAQLCVRLRAKQDGYPQTGRGTIDATGRGTIEMDPAPQVHINPDGPQAADALESAQAEIARLTEEVERLTPRYAQPCFNHEYITSGCPDCGKPA